MEKSNNRRVTFAPEITAKRAAARSEPAPTRRPTLARPASSAQTNTQKKRSVTQRLSSFLSGDKPARREPLGDAPPNAAAAQTGTRRRPPSRLQLDLTRIPEDTSSEPGTRSDSPCATSSVDAPLADTPAYPADVRLTELLIAIDELPADERADVVADLAEGPTEASRCLAFLIDHLCCDPETARELIIHLVLPDRHPHRFEVLPRAQFPTLAKKIDAGWAERAGAAYELMLQQRDGSLTPRELREMEKAKYDPTARFFDILRQKILPAIEEDLVAAYRAFADGVIASHPTHPHHG